MNKLLLTICVLLLCAYGSAQHFSIVQPQCEFKTNPLAINTFNPSFSWQLKSDSRNVSQVAFQILVADNVIALKNNTGNRWDSKRVQGHRTAYITYSGKTLVPGKKYFWSVRVWNNKGQSSISEAANFTVGLLKNDSWAGARWIGYQNMPDSVRTVPGVSNVDTKKKLGPDKLKVRVVVPVFRKNFFAAKRVKAATIYISGLGHYELSINGKKISNSFLAPGWTHYDKTVLYNSYDVTAAIKNGENAIGVIVGHGFHNINRERYIKMAIAYGYPKLICKLLVTYADGSSTTIISDDSWKTAPSPITFTSLFGGEDYDANLENKGWDEVKFGDAHWQRAVPASPPAGEMMAEMDYPITMQEAFSALTIRKPKDSVYMYDFGQNLSGTIELKVQGKKGQVVKLTPAELLHANGLANQNATGRPYFFSYTLKGDGLETWRPRFTYTGFRYVQVEGAVPDTVRGTGGFVKLISLKSVHTSNSSPANGSFECSNKLFNDINSLVKWAIKSNLQSVVTDCPHREKLSWLEQDYLMGAGINANYNVYQLYKKLVQDMMDAQTPDGLVPDIAPEYVFFDDKGFGFRDSPEWGSAAVIVPWLVYKWFGDTALVNKAYPMMKRYVAYLKSKSSNHIIDYGLGDWFDNGPNRPGVAQLTPKSLTATAIYYHDLQLLTRISRMLGKKDDQAFYLTEAVGIQNAFNDTFYNPKAKIYSTGSQTAMAMPLSVGLVPPRDQPAVLQNLIDSINTSGKKLTAGDIGFHFLMSALHDGNASQLIFEMNARNDVPGYGYQIKKGATALTESWAALEEVSNNHLMLGHIMQWFYEGLAGIGQDTSSSGYKHIVIRPEVVGDLTFVRGNHQTIHGNIMSHWTKNQDRFSLNISIPVNTTAVIYLPAKTGDIIMESKRSIDGRVDLKLLGLENGRTKIGTGSGNYSFEVISK